MTDRDEIRKLVEDELARLEVREAMTPRQSVFGAIGAALRHPIVLTLIGFTLTTIVGTYISQEIAQRSERDAQTRGALEAVRSFATQASELRVQQGFLQAALQRDTDATVLRARKAEYDLAYADWNANLHRNALAVREFFGFTYPNFAEQAIHRTLHEHFKAMDRCLTATYDMQLPVVEAVANLAGPPQPGDSRADAVRGALNLCLEGTGRLGVDNFDATARTRERQFQCSRDIFDTLHHFIAKDLHCRSSAWKGGAEGSIVQKSYDTFVEKCGIGGVRKFDSYQSGFRVYCTIPADDGVLGFLQ